MPKKYTTPMKTPHNTASRALTAKRRARQRAEKKDPSLITKGGGNKLNGNPPKKLGKNYK